MKLTDIIHQIGDRIRLGARVTALTGGTRAVDAIVVTNGGSGYTSAPAVGFTGGGGSGAAATAVISGGKVIAVNMTANGTGYTSTPGVTFTGGAGSAAAATAIMLALDLDAIITAAISVTPPIFTMIMLSNVLSIYRLRAGTDAESSPFIIRPDDYAGGTNEKVWQLIGYSQNKIVGPAKTMTYAGTTDIDFDEPDMGKLALTGNVTFTTSNRADGKEKIIRITSDASVRTFTFPAWQWAGTAPADIAASRTALLSIRSWGTTDAEVSAAYSLLTP